MSKKNAKYLKWVRTQPCAMCGSEFTEAHHIIGRGNFSGMGMKARDQFVMPLCHTCHMYLHQTPELWDDQPLMILKTLDKAYSEGVL